MKHQYLNPGEQISASDYNDLVDEVKRQGRVYISGFDMVSDASGVSWFGQGSSVTGTSIFAQLTSPNPCVATLSSGGTLGTGVYFLQTAYASQDAFGNPTTVVTASTISAIFVPSNDGSIVVASPPSYGSYTNWIAFAGGCYTQINQALTGALGSSLVVNSLGTGNAPPRQAYSWTSQTLSADGSFQAGSQSGTLTMNPAYEMNNIPYVPGTNVELTPGDSSQSYWVIRPSMIPYAPLLAVQTLSGLGGLSASSCTQLQTTYLAYGSCPIRI